MGIASLKVTLEEKLSERSAEMGDYLMAQLRKLNSQHVVEIRGKGLMVGIELKTSSGPARPFCDRLAQEGVLAKDTHGQVIRLAPPLVIQKPEIDLLVAAVAKVLG